MNPSLLKVTGLTLSLITFSQLAWAEPKSDPVNSEVQKTKPAPSKTQSSPFGLLIGFGYGSTSGLSRSGVVSSGDYDLETPTDMSMGTRNDDFWYVGGTYQKGFLHLDLLYSSREIKTVSYRIDSSIGSNYLAESPGFTRRDELLLHAYGAFEITPQFSVGAGVFSTIPISFIGDFAPSSFESAWEAGLSLKTHLDLGSNLFGEARFDYGLREPDFYINNRTRTDLSISIGRTF